MINEFSFNFSDECNAYRSGRFDSEAEKIKNQFSEVAHHLASNLADITGCVQSFSSSVIATDTDWKQVSSQISTNMAGKTRSKAVKTVLDISPGPNKLPIDVLYNHLAKS